MDLTLYEKRLGATSVSEAYKNDTINHINDIFSKSPTFKQVLVDGFAKDGIISHKEQSTELELLFRPQETINKGAYVEIDSDTYMIIDFIPNEIYPKAQLELCNSTLKWKDSMGNLKEYKCIVKGNVYEVKENERTNNKYLITSDSELVVLVQYNDDTKTIKPNHRFIFGDVAFDVKSIDTLTNVYNEKGFIKLVVKFTNLTDTDDIINDVADDSGNSGWSGW
jgi:hypothetical protein